MKLDGFVIVSPVNAWNEKNKEKIWLEMGYGSFEKTEAYAWNRFMNLIPGDPDRPRKVQYWHDKGYRVKRATLEIIDD